MLRICLLFGAILLCIAPSANAMSVVPLALELLSSGSGNKSTLRVNNDGATTIPVEIQVFKLTLDENGEEYLQPADANFLVFPPRATIPAGGTQTYRVEWRGEPQLKETDSYMLAVNQLPVALDKSKSGVQIVFNFSVLVNVSPTKSETAVKLISAEIKTDKQTKRPVLLVQNTGTRHLMMANGSVTLSSGSWSKTLNGAELRESIGGLGLVQPNKRRRFTLNTPLPPQISRLDAQVSAGNPR